MEERLEKRAGFLINAAYAAVLIALTYVCIKYLLHWLLPFVLGFLIALLTRPAAYALSRKTGLSDKVAGCGILLAAYLLLGLLLFGFGVVVSGYIRQALGQFPAFYAEVLVPALRGAEQAVNGLIGKVAPGIGGNLSFESLTGGLQDSVLTFSAQAIGWMGNMTAKLPGFLMAFLFTIICSLMIGANYGETTGFITRQFPDAGKGVLSAIKKETWAAARGYVKACLTLLAITFLELVVGLLLLRVEHFGAVAACIALLDLLPLLGTGIVLLPWAFLHLVRGDLYMAAGLALLYAITVSVRGILEPRIVGAQLGLHPLVSLCAVYFGYRTLGFAGMILVPVAVQLLAGLQKSGVIRLWK